MLSRGQRSSLFSPSEILFLHPTNIKPWTSACSYHFSCTSGHPVSLHNTLKRSFQSSKNTQTVSPDMKKWGDSSFKKVCVHMWTSFYTTLCEQPDSAVAWFTGVTCWKILPLDTHFFESEGPPRAQLRGLKKKKRLRQDCTRQLCHRYSVSSAEGVKGQDFVTVQLAVQGFGDMKIKVANSTLMRSAMRLR